MKKVLLFEVIGVGVLFVRLECHFLSVETVSAQSYPVYNDKIGNNSSTTCQNQVKLFREEVDGHLQLLMLKI